MDTKKIIKNIRIVHPDERITSEIMTDYEFSDVLGTRAEQISTGGMVFIAHGDVANPREIALMEIKNKRCPLNIVRVVGGECEVWSVNEMGIPLSQS